MNRIIMLAFLCRTAGCNASVAVVPSDAAPEELASCGAVSWCDDDTDCAFGERCGATWCMSDKGEPVRWCVCGPINPGTGKCISVADCPPETTCWTWACVDAYCQATPKDGGP